MSTDGHAVYFVTIPVQKMVENFRAQQAPPLFPTAPVLLFVMIPSIPCCTIMPAHR